MLKHAVLRQRQVQKVLREFDKLETEVRARSPFFTPFGGGVRECDWRQSMNAERKFASNVDGLLE